MRNLLSILIDSCIGTLNSMSVKSQKLIIIFFGLNDICHKEFEEQLIETSGRNYIIF